MERCVEDVSNQKFKNMKGCEKEVFCSGEDFKRNRMLNLDNEEERKFAVDEGSNKRKEFEKVWR